MCNNSELILGYVYGELPDAERQAFEAHIAGCADCRTDVADLRATRGVLAMWTPPEPDFGFRIVRGSHAQAPAPRRSWFAPAWGLAAAAVLVLAAAAAIANVKVRYDANGLVVRTGWAQDPSAPQDATAAKDAGVVAQGGAAPDQWRAEMAAMQARVLELEKAAAAREAAPGTQLASGPRLSDADMRRHVREAVAQSEARQQREFAMQIAQVVRDLDRAVQLNFLRVQQGLGQHRAQTSAEVAQQVNYYLTRVSQQK